MYVPTWLLAAAAILPLAAYASASGNGTSHTGSLNCRYGKEKILNATVNLEGMLVALDGFIYPNDTWAFIEDMFIVCKCISRPCVRKCCPEGDGVNSADFACVSLPEDLRDNSPAVYTKMNHLPAISQNDVSSFEEHFSIIYGFPCEKPWIPDEYETDELLLFDDGILSAWDEEEFNVSDYCYVGLIDKMRLAPVICGVSEVVEPSRFTINSIGMIVSTPFLGATFVIYSVLTRLHNTHGRCLMSHVLALFMGYLCFSIVNLDRHLSDNHCMGLAFIIYFAFLASFFWLNVMCLDIWWTFSGFRPMRGSVKEREHKKFIIYSLYCWGSPLIMLIICMIMDLHPGIPDNYEKPGFGELKCWFRSNMANFIYFSGPIAILIVCNIILFILTAVKIRQVKRGTKILKKQDSRRHNEEEENNAQRFNLYLKLFLVMGVNWIMEIVSFAAGGPDEYWYITDIANTLQGVLIFIIFVWKDRIRKLLVERFCPSRAVNSNSLANSSSTRTTAIRHNGSVMSSGRPSFRNNKDDYQMKTLTTVRSDDSDIA